MTQANKAYSSADEVVMDVSSMKNDDFYGYSSPGSGKLPVDLFLSAEKQAMSSEILSAAAPPSPMTNNQAKETYSIAEEVVEDDCGRRRDGGEDDDECLSLNKSSGGGGLLGLNHSSSSSPPLPASARVIHNDLLSDGVDLLGLAVDHE